MTQEYRQDDQSWWRRSNVRMKEEARTTIRVLAGRRVLWLLLFIALVIAGILVYVTVWTPLRQEVQLPLGVPIENPRIDRSLLQRLSEGLTVRRRHVPASYFQAKTIFAPLVASPSPSEE